MRRAELAGALELVEYGLKSLATSYLPGYHKGAFHGTAGKLSGFTTLLHRMDPKNIDPVATRRALSPVPLVRLYEARVAITVAALVDLSASMGFEGRARKMAEMAKFAACLSHSAYRLGDRFTLIGFSDDVEVYFPPKRSPEYAWEVGGALWEHEASGRGVDGLDRACALLPRRRSLVFFLSDFHIDGVALERALAQLRRHDVVLTVLWDAGEGEAPLRSGWTELFDPETGAHARRWLRGGLLTRFRETFGARRARLLETRRRFGVDLLYVQSEFDPVEVTRFFVSRRG